MTATQTEAQEAKAEPKRTVFFYIVNDGDGFPYVKIVNIYGHHNSEVFDGQMPYDALKQQLEHLAPKIGGIKYRRRPQFPDEADRIEYGILDVAQRNNLELM